MTRKIKITLSVLLALLLMIPAATASATISLWEIVGAAGFSTGRADYPSLALSGSTPYVAYQDYGNSAKATVMRYNGTDWEAVGTPGFSAGRADSPSLALSGSTPYVAYQDYGNSTKATVMRYNGTAWETVGIPGFSAGQATNLSLAFDGSTPYVGYQDWSCGGKATVMRYNGTAWETVGTPGFSAGQAYYTNLAIYDSVPYMVFQDGTKSSRVTVMRWDTGSTSWQTVGMPGFSASQASYPTIAFNGSTPYVAYQDWGNGARATVMRYNGTDWEAVGTPGFSAGKADYPSVACDGSTPYVAYQDHGNGSKATVMVYNGTNWAAVGTPGFSAGQPNFIRITLAGGIPYVAYKDTSSSKATVMRCNTYDSGSIIIQGTPGAVYQIKQGPAVIRDNVTIPAGGSTTVNDLLMGTYSVVEKTPPLGYLADGTPQEAVLTTDGQTVTLNFASYRPVTISVTRSDASTYGGRDGCITVTAAGGAGTYEYSIGGTWQDSNVFGGLTAGLYSVQVRDKANTSNISETVLVEITQPAATVITEPVITQPVISGSMILAKFPAKLNKGTFYQITLPAGYSNPTFTSSNNGIAAVDGSGLVNFLAGGKVKLTLKATFKGKIKTVSKSITVLSPVTGISLSQTELSVTKGKSTKLAATVLPGDASNKKVTWKSSNTKVATVSQSGAVSGKSPGTAIITATAKDGSKVSASCLVTVTPIYPTGIKLSKGALTVKLGKTAALKATVLPKNTDFKIVTWASSNAAVAMVANGKITGVSTGTAIVTATMSNGLTAVCTVTVQ